MRFSFFDDSLRTHLSPITAAYKVDHFTFYFLLGRLPLPPSRQPGGELMPLWAAERSGASPKGVNPQKDG